MQHIFVIYSGDSLDIEGSALGGVNDLPEHRDDFDWDMVSEVFFQDHDILSLFDDDLDGIEDPDTDVNRQAGMGDYRPRAWFATFNNMEPRDPGRRFRR